MGMYVAVRGWLEFDHAQRARVEQVLADHRDDHYSGGWAFPVRPFNGTLYLLYGGDIGASAVGWLRDQVAELAHLDPVAADRDMPAGFFLLSDEGQRSLTWTVRDGRLQETEAPKDLRWFAGRP